MLRFAVLARAAGAAVLLTAVPTARAQHSGAGVYPLRPGAGAACGLLDVVVRWGPLALGEAHRADALDTLLACTAAPEAPHPIGALPDPWPCAGVVKRIADVVVAETWLRRPIYRETVREPPAARAGPAPPPDGREVTGGPDDAMDRMQADPAPGSPGTGPARRD